MPKAKKGGASDAEAATPATRLRVAKAALETGERRHRAAENAKAITYFQTVCSTLAEMRDDPQACLLWASAMESLVELGAPSWSGQGVGGDTTPSLHLSWSALERGHAAAAAAGAPSDEMSQLLAARAETAELTRDSLAGGDRAAAVQWAEEGARLWEQTLAQELDAQREGTHAPEASVETLCSLGGACMAYGTLALSRADASRADASHAVGAKSRRAAQAAVKRGLEVFDEACGLCDSARGDDLPEVLFQWARALWDACEVVPAGRRPELLRLAIEKSAASMRLQPLPSPETSCLLGDLLIDLGEATWRGRVEAAEAAAAKAAAGGAAAGETSSEQAAAMDTAAAASAVWLIRRALHQGYGAAMRVRSSDLAVLCGLADALLDAGRLQREMAARGVDVAARTAAQSEAAQADASPPPQPLPCNAPAVSAADSPADVTDATAGGESAVVDGLAEAIDSMEVEEQPPMDLGEAHMQLVPLPPPEPPASLPPLPAADACLERALALYTDVLGRPAAEWAAATVSRIDAAYNAACACALRAGREEECARLLSALAAEGALARSEVEKDEDLAPLVPTAWMQSLLGSLER